MKKSFATLLTLLIASALLSSCSTSDEILKALKIDYRSADKDAPATLSKAELEKQLAAAKKRETTLKQRVAALEKEMGEADAALDTRMTELRDDLNQREEKLNEELKALRQELEEKEALISIQSKVIGLLDDADQTLQKSIEDQRRARQ